MFSRCATAFALTILITLVVERRCVCVLAIAYLLCGLAKFGSHITQKLPHFVANDGIHTLDGRMTETPYKSFHQSIWQPKFITTGCDLLQKRTRKKWGSQTENCRSNECHGIVINVPFIIRFLRLPSGNLHENRFAMSFGLVSFGWM